MLKSQITSQLIFSSYILATHTLLVVKHFAHTGNCYYQSEKNEAAEHYGDGLYGSHETLCGTEETRPVKYYAM